MKPLSILVIDDEEDMRELATFALEIDGRFTVLSASGGAEGVTMARTQQPTAILLDWMMPDMGGAATLAALKSDATTALIPVVVLSGAARPGATGSFRFLGAHGALAKPFNPMTLAAELRALLEDREHGSQ